MTDAKPPETLPVTAPHLTALYRRNLNVLLNATQGVSEDAAHRQPHGASSLNGVAGHVSTRLIVLSFLNTGLDGLEAAAIRAVHGRDTRPDPLSA